MFKTNMSIGIQNSLARNYNYTNNLHKQNAEIFCLFSVLTKAFEKPTFVRTDSV